MIKSTYFLCDVPAIGTLIEEHISSILFQLMEQAEEDFDMLNSSPAHLLDYSYEDAMARFFPKNYPHGKIKKVFGELKEAVSSSEETELTLLQEYILYKVLLEEIEMDEPPLVSECVVTLPLLLKELITEYYAARNTAPDTPAITTAASYIASLENLERYPEILFRSTCFLELDNIPEDIQPDYDYNDILNSVYDNAFLTEQALQEFLSSIPHASL